MSNEFKWKTYVARPVEVEAYQAKERTVIQQKPNERTTGMVYAQIGAWIVKAAEELGYPTILSDEEFKRLYQPTNTKAPPRTKVLDKKEDPPPEKPVAPVNPAALDGSK